VLLLLAWFAPAPVNAQTAQDQEAARLHYSASFIPIGNWSPLPNRSGKQQRGLQIAPK
jgi:hypothetical protein